MAKKFPALDRNPQKIETQLQLAEQGILIEIRGVVSNFIAGMGEMVVIARSEEREAMIPKTLSDI